MIELILIRNWINFVWIGIIQTFNFAENGRHLANQEYRSCVRQETGKCSISYEPCDENSFGIGPTHSNGMPGGPFMTGTGGMGTGGMGTSGSTLSDPGQAGLFDIFCYSSRISNWLLILF